MKKIALFIAAVLLAFPVLSFSDSIIDNFEDGDWNSTTGQEDGQWQSNTWATFTMGQNEYANPTYFLKVDYAKSQADYSFIDCTNLDFSGKHGDFTNDSKLSFNIWASAPFPILFKFKDINGNESQDSGRIIVAANGSWLNYSWDFSGIDWQSCDRANVKTIIIFPYPGELGSGTFYIDDVCVGDQTHIIPTLTATPTVSPTNSPTFTITPTPTETATPSATMTSTTTPTPTVSPTVTMTASPSPSPTATSTITPISDFNGFTLIINNYRTPQPTPTVKPTPAFRFLWYNY